MDVQEYRLLPDRILEVHVLRREGTMTKEQAEQQIAEELGFYIAEGTSYVQAYPFTAPHLYTVDHSRGRLATAEEVKMHQALVSERMKQPSEQEGK
jgi:hypothetical protein